MLDGAGDSQQHPDGGGVVAEAVVADGVEEQEGKQCIEADVREPQHGIG
jgi:hypothetical protein